MTMVLYLSKNANKNNLMDNTRAVVVNQRKTIALVVGVDERSLMYATNNNEWQLRAMRYAIPSLMYDVEWSLAGRLPDDGQLAGIFFKNSWMRRRLIWFSLRRAKREILTILEKRPQSAAQERQTANMLNYEYTLLYCGLTTANFSSCLLSQLELIFKLSKKYNEYNQPCI